MSSLKNIIYLDEYKLISLSSQLFEGVTEHLISRNTESRSESEQQKGEFGSGRILADAIRNDRGTEEKKVLHDHLYSVFENTLTDTKMVKVVTSESVTDKESDYNNYSFIKIKFW